MTTEIDSRLVELRLKVDAVGAVMNEFFPNGATSGGALPLLSTALFKFLSDNYTVEQLGNKFDCWGARMAAWGYIDGYVDAKLNRHK